MPTRASQEGISKLCCPEDKRSVQVCDAQHRGLLLELRRTDQEHPTWYVRYKDPSKRTKYVRLGHYPSVSLSQARQLALVTQAEIRLGKDPRAEEEAKKAVPTFSEYMESTYFKYIRTRKRTAAKDEEYYRLRMKAAFGHKQLNLISRRDIQLFHSKLRDEGLAPATCNLYLRTLKTAMNRAIHWEIIDGPNPVVGIQQYRELNLVENYMDDEQLQRLMTVLKQDKNRTVCDIILFLLSTGARLSEVLNMKHEMVNTERRVWRIPATNSKSGKVRAVPLNDTALDVLSEQNTKDEFEHVFINRQTGKPYTTIQKVWNRLRNAADLGHVRIHDLRHQYASFLVNNGATLYTTGQILGHSTPKVTQRYAHLSTATLQDAAATAADQIKAAMKKTA
jgi:integrase